MSMSGSKIREQVAHFLVDIHKDYVIYRHYTIIILLDMLKIMSRKISHGFFNPTLTPQGFQEKQNPRRRPSSRRNAVAPEP